MRDLVVKNTSMNTTINLLKSTVEQFPTKEAIYDGTRRMTYEELDKESNAIASQLKKIGIQKGDHVAVSLPNWHEFIVAIFAIAKAGAVIVPFNTRYHYSEVQYILNHAKVKAAFFTEEVEGNRLGEAFYKVYETSESLEHLIAVRCESDKAFSYSDMLKNGDPDDTDYPEVTPDDVAIIMYTSGTTGSPKGAMLTHSNIVITGSMTAEFLRCTPDDVFLIPVPIFHIFGMVPGMTSAVSARAKMVLTQEYKAEKILQVIEQEKVTVHHGVPTMFILELNHPNLEKYDLSSLRTGIVAAAPVPSEVIRKIREKMHCEVLTSYGMTEASPCLTCCSFEDDDVTRAETVGKAMPGVELKIINPETGEEVPTGEVGEITARTPGIMKGYYNMPEKTMEVLSPDGWYRTGDLGTIDEEGNVRIVGRKKDLIIRGGYNIYPREIEEHFYKHESVLEATIVGLPDTVLGEVSCAAIVLKEGATVTEEQLRAYIKERVADFKVPDLIVFLDKLPMTASGKISKVKLQEQLKVQLADRLR